MNENADASRTFRTSRKQKFKLRYPAGVPRRTCLYTQTLLSQLMQLAGIPTPPQGEEADSLPWTSSQGTNPIVPLALVAREL